MMERQGGKRVAFVASGGAGKGLAHLGALRACEEAGIEIDLFVGTSAGAMACAFAAAGVDSESLVRPFRCSRGARRWGGFRSPIPIFSRPNLERLGLSLTRSRGLLRAEGIELFLRNSLPANYFDAMPKALHVVATDLASSARVVFSDPSEVLVSRAVAASMCLPVVFRPYHIGGREYYDGSISRSLSLDVACRAGAERVIASMVHAPYQDEAGGFPHRGMMRIVGQALNAMARGRAYMEIELCRQAHPEVEILLVEPPRRDAGLVNAFNPRAAWEVIVSGYAAARRALRLAGLLS
jgi:NTE family protein